MAERRRFALTRRGTVLQSTALFVALWATVFATTASVSALPRFTTDIQEHLGMSQPPSCTLCHASTAGGGAVVQPFGRAMLAAGLEETSNAEEVARALDELEGARTDSNGDGISDVESLRMDPPLDPNSGGDPIKYGCGGQIARAEPRGIASWVSAVGLGILMMSRALRRRGNFPTKDDVRPRSVAGHARQISRR